eukprot:gene10182-12047_t
MIFTSHVVEIHTLFDSIIEDNSFVPPGIVNVKPCSDEDGKAFEKKEDATESSTALTNREIHPEGERNTSTPPKKLPESIGGGSQDGTVMAPSMESSKGKLPDASTSSALPKLEPVNPSSKVASFLKPPDEFDENDDDVLSLGNPIAKPTDDRLDLEDTSMTKLYRPGQKKGDSVDGNEFHNETVHSGIGRNSSSREPRQSSTSQARSQPQPDWLVGEDAHDQGFHGSSSSQSYGVRFGRSADVHGVDESEIGDVMGEEFAHRPFEPSSLREDSSFPIKPLEAVEWDTGYGSPRTSQYAVGTSDAEGHESHRMEYEEEEPPVKKDDPWANIQSQYQISSIQDGDSRAPSARGPRAGRAAVSYYTEDLLHVVEVTTFSREPRRPHTAVLGEEGDEERYEDDDMNEADGVVLWDGVQPISNVAPEDWQPVEDVDDSEILYDDAALPQPIVVHITEDGVYAQLPPPQLLAGMEEEEDLALQYSEEELYASNENTGRDLIQNSHPQKEYGMGYSDERDIDFPSAPSTPGAPAEPIEVLDFNDFSDDFGLEPIRA